MSLRTKYPLENSKPLKKTIASSFVLVLVLLFFVYVPFLMYSFAPSSEVYVAPELTNFYQSFFSSSFLYLNYFLLTILAICIISRYLYESYYLKYYFYDLAGKNIIIKKGVFSRNEITLPINRLQDVYVDQDVLDRMFGLYDVHVSSATAISGNLSHIDGLNKNNSEVIKKLILSGIHRK